MNWRGARFGVPYIMLSAATLPLSAGCDDRPASDITPAGEEASVETKALSIGAQLLQTKPALNGYDLYLDGFHPLKNHPEHSMEAHHLCKQVNEEFAQCILFDANTSDANLTGIEYIVSERIFDSLPAAEKSFWHPHNYEILSGQLVAPGLPDLAEHEALAKKMNSYGKTWHVWMTGTPSHPGDKLPLGPAELAWSYNADREMPQDMLMSRDQRLGIDSLQKRNSRSDLVAQARPQSGVDALAGSFPSRQRIAGVTDRASTGKRGDGGQ